MRTLAIDPGNERSAWLVLDGGRPDGFGIEDNEGLLQGMRDGAFDDVGRAVIERVESYGMAVGREVFDTVRWEGRFAEALDYRAIAVHGMPRRNVKLAICGSPKAKDSNIRAALIDRFGGLAETRKGGILYGVSKDVWSALAIAVTWELERAA